MKGKWEQPPLVKAAWKPAVAVLVASVLAELLVHRHGTFGVDGTFGFDAWFGFGACVIAVLFSKLLGLGMQRRDDYYRD